MKWPRGSRSPGAWRRSRASSSAAATTLRCSAASAPPPCTLFRARPFPGKKRRAWASAARTTCSAAWCRIRSSPPRPSPIRSPAARRSARRAGRKASPQRVHAVVLPGFSAFTRADALKAAQRLLEDGPVRLKHGRGIGGKGQWVAKDAIEVAAALEAIEPGGARAVRPGARAEPGRGGDLQRGPGARRRPVRFVLRHAESDHRQPGADRVRRLGPGHRARGLRGIGKISVAARTCAPPSARRASFDAAAAEFPGPVRLAPQLRRAERTRRARPPALRRARAVLANRRRERPGSCGARGVPRRSAACARYARARRKRTAPMRWRLP